MRAAEQQRSEEQERLNAERNQLLEAHKSASSEQLTLQLESECRTLSAPAASPAFL